SDTDALSTIDVNGYVDTYDGVYPRVQSDPETYTYTGNKCDSTLLSTTKLARVAQ
ncbi:hypothetical protein SARC_14652, partial [Sphaeroforma arctica JP610]